jgi:predicted RNase H-like HicB family nuclease
MTCSYSMIIQWSDEDQTFVVSLPEFGPYAKTHGDTYEEAVRMGREALESLIEAYQADGQPLPEAAKYQTPISA